MAIWNVFLQNSSNDKMGLNGKINIINNNTEIYQKHLPYSIGYYLKNRLDGKKSEYFSYTRQDCISWFIKQMHNLAYDVDEIYEDIRPMNLTLKRKDNFKVLLNFIFVKSLFSRGN